MFIFSFCLDAKRKNEPKKKNTLITAMPDGIAPLAGYKYKMFIRFCPNGQKSIRRLKNGAFDNNLTSARRCP